jgi:CheY-like chemotaxis protein/HPt (histidine-containing phosphotransfer) domain-containing protein
VCSSDLPDTHENLMFRVVDTGIGIPSDKLDAVFESFTQADSFIKRQFGGTGLGLAICKRLAELMGGTIGVESVEGEGSKFFVILPFRKSDEKPESEKMENIRLDESIPPITILLADDIEPNRTVIHRYLQKSPVTIVDAVNGLEAYESYIRGEFDLVLMDVEMPVMSGLESTMKIRKWERENSRDPKPLVILSAHAFGEQRKQCFDAGCNDLLVKPIRKNELVKAIHSILKEGTVGDVQKNQHIRPSVTNVHGPAADNHDESGREKVYIDVMFEDLINGFFEYFEETLSRMDKAVVEKNYDDLYRLGHGLKGSARNYEFFKLGELFFEVEKAAADKNIDGAVFYMKKARHYLENVDVEFVEKD